MLRLVSSKGSHGPMSSKDLYLLNSMKPTFLAITPSGRRYPLSATRSVSHVEMPKVDVVELLYNVHGSGEELLCSCGPEIQSASSVLSEGAQRAPRWLQLQLLKKTRCLESW